MCHSVLCFTVGPLWLGAVVAVRDNHPVHTDCMFMLCQPHNGNVLTGAPLRWETEKIAGYQICMRGG
jgi:hypothetical protein